MAKKVEKPRTQTANAPSGKGGRPRAYTPEALEAKFEEYVEWAKANPRYNNRVLSDGSIIAIPTERPLTLSSFAVFAQIVPRTFREYEKLDEFSLVCARVRAKIESDQMEGAMCEQYNPTIASRVLQLTDRHDVTTDGKEIMPATPAITFTVDEAAASIIQSIGKQTINTSQADGE